MMDFTKLTQFLGTVQEQGVPGIDLAVYYKGEQVYRHMTGTCDYLRKKPVTEDTLYWIYSMTKPVVMTAAKASTLTSQLFTWRALNMSIIHHART